jgi:hypothetical protein
MDIPLFLWLCLLATGIRKEKLISQMHFGFFSNQFCLFYYHNGGRKRLLPPILYLSTLVFSLGLVWAS